MSDPTCKHPDIRKFDGLRCCLACGETVFEASASVSLAKNVDNIGHYKYTRLNYELGLEIRLVVLLPGDSADPIYCEILHVNLDDKPDYDAVSYTWATESGDASLSKTIRCVNGSMMAVTANCEAALRQLRRRGLRRRLWIDAMCIDQTNVDERNHQVNRMDRVYTLASNVCMCVQGYTDFSSGTDYSALFLKSDRTQAPDSLPSLRSLVSSAAQPRIPQPFSDDLYPLARQLFSMRYFKRVWVLQEVILARNAYVVINDREFLLTSAVLKALISFCSRFGHPPPSVFSWRAAQNTTSDILSCLYASTNCEMTDSRDGIYAMLSLMESQSRSLISVNYASSVESVYASAIAAAFLRFQDLAILSYVGVGTLTSPEGNTSSTAMTSAGGWQTAMCLDMARLRLFVLDDSGSSSYDRAPRVIPKSFPPQFETHSMGPWRPTVDIEVASPEDYRQGILSGGSHACIVELPRPTHTDFLPRICIRAHYVDKVDAPAPRPPDEGNITTIAYSVLYDPRSLNNADLAWIVPLLGGRSSKRSDKYWLPKQSDINWPMDVFRISFESWLNLATEADLDISETNLAAIWNFFHEIDGLRLNFSYELDGLHLNSYCFSGHFSFGFARVGIQTGDEVFVVDGMRTPLVLRRTGDNQYRIVGECWFWAALELDCWNPGTKKGKWGEDVERPTVTQTRMIEIH